MTFPSTLAKAGLAATLAFSSLAWAEIYRWVDERGVVHFSDTPPRATGRPEAGSIGTLATIVPPVSRGQGKSAPAAAAVRLLPGSPSRIDRITAESLRDALFQPQRQGGSK
jgi:hypothetical protein